MAVLAAAGLPAALHEQIQSWDCPFKDLRAVREMSARCPYTFAKLIEDKANGRGDPNAPARSRAFEDPDGLIEFQHSTESFQATR